MSRVNLLPAEIKRQRANLRLARRIRFFGVCAVLLLGGLYGVRTFEVMGLRGDLEDVLAEQAAVQSQIDGFADAAKAQAAVESVRTLVSGLTRGEISWSQQMLHVATTMPPDFKVTSLTGTALGDPSQVLIGSISVTATTKGFTPVRSWIDRLAAQEGWTNVWVSSAQGLPDTTFNGTVDLTQEALSARGAGA